MSWLSLIFAGSFEVLGVYWLNQYAIKVQKRFIILLAITFALSLWFLSISMRTIPMGTAYAVWTGIGTVGGTVLGMIAYHESKHFLRIFFIFLIIVSAIGLKLIA
ncbi:DMT family transporter [Staphylococcus canis]|uniref:Multidrug efflux SMR transporter n=1 Tax=Staphylococcus canis TaxID=2724942 RepID=A0ABS0T777_9STAP|nr:multidrug efflux SMR transporter [Staphylococcus canis]MBI5974598.1 multidrug efflux SMR transporter [Staphylococcus canis]